MTAYIRWFQQYMLAKTSSWVARHPIETAIGFTALYYERKLTMQLIATYGLEMTSFLTGWRPGLRIGGTRYAYNGVIRGTGSALARRFPEQAARASKVRNVAAASRTRAVAFGTSPLGLVTLAGVSGIGYVATSSTHKGATGMLAGDMNMGLPVTTEAGGSSTNIFPNLTFSDFLPWNWG